MKCNLLLVLLLLVVAEAALDARWVLLFADEFSGNSLDTSKWTARDQGGYQNNGEFQWYTPSQVSVSNGNLVIKSESATPKVVNGYVYNHSSGFLDTNGKFSTTYGRYEIRAKLPASKGMWPAHWLLSQTKCWPVGAEIDIMEAVAKPATQIHGTYHFGECCGCNNGNGTGYNTGVDYSLDYHVYAVEWNPGKITWFYDDYAYFTIYNTSVNKGQPFTMDTSPHYMILNTAVGGFWPGAPTNTTWPQYHYVDYVRIYGWQPCATGCSGHGCCAADNTCKCDNGYAGTFCEYTPGTSYQNSFVATTAGDTLSDNAVIKNGLTVTMTACSNCGTNPVKGGSWMSAETYGIGSFTFIAKIPRVSGTGTVLSCASTGSSYAGFHLTFSNNDLALQTFAPSTYVSFRLPFNVTSDYHNYTVEYGRANFTLYADGVRILSTPGTNVPLRMGIKYEFNTGYYGAWNNGPLSSLLVRSASWIGDQTKAQCDGITPSTSATSSATSSTKTTATTSSPSSSAGPSSTGPSPSSSSSSTGPSSAGPSSTGPAPSISSSLFPSLSLVLALSGLALWY